MFINVDDDYNNMNKVLLVTASTEDVKTNKKFQNKEFNQNFNDSQHYPIGIAYLHSYVESKGIDIESLFLNSYSYELCFKEVIDNITT